MHAVATATRLTHPNARTRTGGLQEEPPRRQHPPIRGF